MTESLSIDGSGPLPVRRPASVAELCDLVKQQRSAKQAVYPVGGRTMLDYGLPPTKPGVALDTTALGRVIDHPAKDMTITAEAGVTVVGLQAALAKEGQWLPIDVPRPDRATLGGVLAANVSGPRRYGYGTLRDYIIGISFVTDDGVEVKGGGRVVKNVAGYDLMKLQTGALGTLGVITRVTLKVRPKPEAVAAVTFGVDSAALGPTLDLLHASKSRPVAVEVLNAAAWRAAGVGPPGAAEWQVVAAFEEKRATVEWQVATLLAELRAANVTEVRGESAGAILAAITELQTRPESRFIWKANVLSGKVAAMLTDPLFARQELIHAEALNGIVWLHSTVDSWPESTQGYGGDIVTRRAPPEWKKPHRVGPPSGGAWELMKHLKRTLDPDGVFNPGRLFGDV